MRIAFNPSTVAALIAPPNNKDITFDLRGQNIFARGVKFCGTDTNTWRDIKINNISIGSNTLDLRDGDNTTLTNINGVVTINSTWRPVVDNLTSDSTTSSLSANLGRVLKALIEGKSDSEHTHDDRYLRLTGGWMSGDITFGGDNKIIWGRNTDSASISFKNDGDGDADSYMSFVTSDNGNEYFRWSHSSGSTNTEWMSLRSDGLRVGGTKVSLEGHSHNDLYYTKTEVNNKLNGKSDTGHTHDDRYLKLTGGIVNGVVGINATGVCGNSVLTVGPQDKRINTGIVDRYGTMLQIVGTGKKNEGGVIGFHNPGLYSAIIGFVRDTNETGFIFDTDVDRNSWYVKARAFKGNLIGDADSVDGVHMDWSTNYTAGNYLAIWDNAGNCIRPIPKGSTSVGYATSAGNADTVDSKHASDFASSGHNHDNRYVRKWTGVYGSANKFLKLAINDEKGWIRLEVSDSNNSLTAGYGIYMIGWGYHGDNGTDTLFARCLYANDSRYITALKVVRTSRNNYDFYFLFASGSSYPSYTINYSSSVYSIDCTVTAIDTIPTATWTSSLSALQLNASQVDWSGITNKPSAFNPSAHTHTVFKNNLMIKGTNGISDSASIHLGIGDSDTGFKWISDGVCQIYANNVAVGEWTSGGMNWFTNPTVNDNKIWNAGNDGSGSGLDADTVDSYHASSLWRSDGGIWNPGANISLNASANNQEWSFDIRRNGYTGCYWHVWDSTLSTMLKVNADNGKVYAPYNFVGNLEGNSSTATNTQNIRIDQYASTGEYPIIWADSASSNANNNTISRLYKTWKYLYWTPNKKTLTLAGNGTKCAIGSALDTNDRPGLHITGNYPELIMMSLNVSNANHGSTIVLGAYTSNSDSETNYRAFAIGMNGPTTNEAFLDFGYGANMPNPHSNGIANYGSGSYNNPYIMRLAASKRVFIQGIGDDLKPALLVNALRNGTWVYTASFLAPNLTSNNNNAIFIGKSHNTCNAFGLTHMHIKDGSASNYAALEVWGVGNVLRWYYDRHSAFLHRADFSSLGSDASYMNSALLIREHGYNGVQADTWANAPRMSWHWSGRVLTQIGLGSDNELYLSKNNFSSAYKLMYETGTWGINITGNAASATNADMLDGYHANSFLIDRGGNYSGLIYDLPCKSIFSGYDLSDAPTTGWVSGIVLGSNWNSSHYQHYLVEVGSRWYATRSSSSGKMTNWNTFAYLTDIPTVTNYYWANVKISTSSSTTTSPTVSNLTATSSIRMGNILLQNTDEINNSANGSLYLNYRNSGNVILCIGGGNVGISNSSPSYKLDVNGLMRASGFRHSSVNSDNYMLLAGGGYKSFGGSYDNPIFLGYLNLEHGNDGTISSSFYCLGYSVSFTYTRGGNYCKISIPDTTYLSFYIRAAIASVNYSGGGMDTWTGYRRGDGAWWLHCYAYSSNEVRVKGFRLANDTNDSWWGGNPLWSSNGGANRITVCIFGYVTFR